MFTTDSSVWIDWTKRVVSSTTTLLRERLSSDEHVITDVVLYEILQGFRPGRALESLTEQLLLLPVVSVGGIAIALAAANNYRYLRGRGITVRSSIDCLIATYCIETGTALLHNDRDFDPFEEHLGLKVAR
jgi:predicted nucleic acid-binding protein